MLACLLNDELRRQVVVIFVGWVVDNFVITFVVSGFQVNTSSW
jgi:hypothetical protein